MKLSGRQMAKAQSLVLDTHVWLWFVTGNSNLSKGAIAEVTKAALAGRVLIPAICVWEVAMLEERGRITLNKPVTDWIAEALDLPGISLYPSTPDVSVESCRLPGSVHGDPADRMIIATARIESSTIFTRDKRIIDYSKLGFVSAQAV